MTQRLECDGGGGRQCCHVDQDSVWGGNVTPRRSRFSGGWRWLAGFHLREETITMEQEVEEASYAIKSFFLGMRFQHAFLSALDTCSGGASSLSVFIISYFHFLVSASHTAFFFFFFGFM